jgi:Flp pilus assembly protein TadD
MRDPLAGYAWAASLAKLGDFKQATVVLTELDRNELPPDTLLLVAQLWLTIEDYSQAIVAIERALKVRPDLPRAHYLAGVAYTQWQKQGEAIREFQAQLALTPDDQETKNNLGYVLLEQGKSQEAESLFRDVLQNHPENGMAQYQLGKILLERNDVAGAVAHLETAAHSLPEADYVHYQLQAAYRKASRNEDADRELQRYKELKARNRQASIPRPAPPTP